MDSVTSYAPAKRLCLAALAAAVCLHTVSAKVAVAGFQPNPKQQVMVDAAGSLAEGSTRRLQATNVNIGGFTLPTSFHWSPDQSKIYVAEKGGAVWRLNGYQGSKGDAVKVLDISPQVFTYGDHGLTSIWIDVNGAPYMYVSYMLNDPTNPNLKYTCTDYGQFDGRPMAQMNGCATWGRFSRWPLDAAGNVAGPEQILMDGYELITVEGETTYRMCAQFSTHSVTSIAQDPNTGLIYVSAGDGAAFTNTDYGQMGQNPCRDRAAYRGAFRVQDPARVNGKILQFNPQTLTYRTFSTGHRNPWRIHWDRFHNRLLEVETGWYSYEEINIIEDGQNYGWPCFEGPINSPHYDDPDEAGRPFHGHAVCQWLAESNNWARPAFAYAHPQPPPPNNVLSISAVAAVADFVFYGDYTLQTTNDLDNNFGNEQVLARAVNPCELRVLPDATVAYVDHLNGQILTVNFNAPVASPSPSRAPARAWIEASASSWTPGSGQTLTFTAHSNVEGREGMFFVWEADLGTCAPKEGGTNPQTVCDYENLAKEQQVAVFQLPAPAEGGMIQVKMQVRTHGGFVLPADPIAIASNGNPCGQCDQFPAPITSVEGSGGNGLLSSPAALGGVIAAAVLVGLGAILLVAWFAGVPQRLGLMGVHPNETASRRPAHARQAAHAATGGQNETGTGAGNLAQRRGLPKTPSLGPDVASAPKNVVPVTPHQGPTPHGERKV